MFWRGISAFVVLGNQQGSVHEATARAGRGAWHQVLGVLVVLFPLFPLSASCCAIAAEAFYTCDDDANPPLSTKGRAHVAFAAGWLTSFRHKVEN